MNIFEEYDNVLIGEQESISPLQFGPDPRINHGRALSVFRYAIEYVLGWTPEEAQCVLSEEILRFMKLDGLYRYLILPSDWEPGDTDYILYLLYPRKMPYNVAKYAVRTYKRVLAGEMRYPQDYMYGYLGMLRARICLQYSLNQDGMFFDSAEDVYKLFASPEGARYLERKNLLQLCNSFYFSPVEYLHESMPKNEKSEFLYQVYSLAYYLRKKRPDIFGLLCKG